ncbi:Inactive histone-lysine N-methyltransferase 2E [Acropora cervicornis]|uniref:Inactive histone-lysine N-methyltransferase 2E n=1 Tax=Acropora cervicornis TaxID=6130 RepID=A0AAD9VEJ7_ACRCE|nr:Inactive histone-lysine N-methyltransferase 2E [Acropora cervicornis]
MTVVSAHKPSRSVVSPQPAESSKAPKMPSVASIRHAPLLLDHNYGQPPPMTPPDSISPGPEDADTGNEDDEDDSHIECMGISSDAVPDNYLCDQCQPRMLDREHDDDEDNDSEEDRETPTYTAVSNTPTRITLTAKVSRKRKRGPSKIKVKEHNATHRQKQKPSPGFVPVDEDTNEAWDNTCNSYDDYEELKENIYGKEFEQLALNSIQENGCAPVIANDEQLCKVVEVERFRKGIVTTEDLDKNKCSPYVFYYSEMDHLQLCVDARTHGNDARFARRSCSPNSVVKHFLLNGRVCLGIFSSCPLPKGAEITIPFEFQFEEYHSYMDCACRQEMCAVMKYNSKNQNQNHDAHAQKRLKPYEEDSNSNSQQKMSPLRVSLPNSQGLQGDSDSDIENNPEKQAAKKTREQRKLEVYLKQIEKMEKKEKRKQQTQKDSKQEQVSPVSQQEAPFNNKLATSIKNVKGMKRTMNKRRTGALGVKRKRTRLSSCSSEPLSPDDHSSTASTPTTPMVTSASSQPDAVPESSSGTPSTSPSRAFRFSKDSKQCLEEEVKETPSSGDAVASMKTEPVEQSVASTPGSPITPRDDNDAKPVLNTATSTTEQDPLPDSSDAVTGSDAVCSSTTDSNQLSKDVKKTLPDCLTEISASVVSGTNTPSPCPSTAGSPTSAESSGCSVTTERTSPGPAPGSPLASVKFGQRMSRTSPLYGSLKKRWLFQYLYGQNLTNDRPPNGVRINVNNTMHRPRRLRIFHNLSSEWNETPGTLLSQALREAEPLYVSSPAPLEQPVQIVLADSVNNLQPHREEATTNNEQPFSTEDSLLRIKTSTTPSGTEPPYLNSTVTSATNSAEISQRRPIDPRLGNSCPVSSSGVNPALSPGGGWPVATSAVPALAVTGQPVLSYSQNNDSSGTPGKKKVSLLEYRNRSRNRLSVDLPRPLPPSTAPSTAPVSASVALFSSVIKSAVSLPNLTVSPAPSTITHRPVSSVAEMNGPHLEPVSPDLEDKSGLSQQSSKFPNSSFGRGVYSSRLEIKGAMNADGDSRLKREIQKKHEQLSRKEQEKVLFAEKLTSLISEELQKDSKAKPSSMMGRSPSTSSSESSNPSAEFLVISHSTHLSHSTLAHSTQIPQRSSLLSQFHQPSVNHRIGHPPVYVSQQAAHQLSSPSQPPPRLPSNSPKYLVTSPSGSAHVRFQSPYQGSPSQTAGFFHH